MRSKVRLNQKHGRSRTSQHKLTKQRSVAGKNDGGLLPQVFLAYVAQTGLIGGKYVVPISLRIQCAKIAAPYFASKLKRR